MYYYTYNQLYSDCLTVNITRDLPIIDMKTYTKQGFTCHYCSKVLCSRQRLDSHIERYHRETDTKDDPPGFTCYYCSKVLCSRQRLDSHIERNHRETDTKDAPPNKVQRLGDVISNRNADDCERMDSENCGREALLKHIDRLQYGTGYNADDGDNDNADETSDMEETESDVSDAGNTDDDNDEEDEEDDDEEDDDEYEEEEDDNEEEDIFDKVLQVATHNLSGSEGGYTHKELRKEFRLVYKDMVLQKRLLNKSRVHKRIMKTVGELRELHPDFSFTEALDEAVRLRRRILFSLYNGIMCD